MTTPPSPKPLADLDDDLWDDAPSPQGDASSSRHGSGVSLWMVFGILAAAGAVLFIVLDGADDAVFAYTVDQAVAQQDLDGKTFRVRGTVLDGTVEHKPGTVDTKFNLIHEGKQITIVYNKALPDTFDAGIEVIAEGKLNRAGVLEADNIIAKCPSKYEEQAPTANAKHPENIPRD